MKKICLKCGGNSLISDRSLGGRIVCKRCGSSSIGYKGFLSVKNKKFFYLMIIFVVFFIIIIL